MSNITENNETNNIKIGYKVVCRVNSKAFKPATVYALQSFRYRIEQTTVRDDEVSGPMAVFDTLENAEKFFKEFGDAILEVEYQESEENCLWKKKPPIFIKNRYGKGYHAESAGISLLDEEDCPTGTVFADTVTPIRVVTAI